MRISSRRRKRSRVLVERETWETAGVMDATVSAKPAFPYSNWGPLAAILGLVLALGVGVLLSIPVAQLAGALSFLLVPIAIATWRGATPREALRRLGLRGFRPSAIGWMFAAIGAYLLIAIVYVAIAGTPEQEDIAEGFGALPVQIFLIVFAAPIAEEVCFRGMLFGGLREHMPRIAAALLSAAIFGGLHATTGVSAIPPLIGFGFVLCLLYEKTGSIVPGIILHMLNNSVALLGQ